MASIADFFGRLFGRAPEPPPRLELPAPPTSADLLGAVDRVEALVRDSAVPAPVASRVSRVTKIVRETIPRLDRIGGGSLEAYSVMATATDYLPEAVGGYLRLPRDWANSRPIDNGRTSLMVLIDQLDLLARTMDQVFDAVNRSDAAALVAHGRFLQEKFGHTAGGGSLGLSPGETPVPPQVQSGPVASGPVASGSGASGSGASGSGPSGSGPRGPEATGSGVTGSGTNEPGRLAPPERGL